MIRTVLWYMLFWLYMFFSLFMTIPVILLALPGLKRFQDGYIKFTVVTWARCMIAAAGGNVTVQGADNIPQNGGICYIANHQGSFDIPLILAHLPNFVGFIAKKELKMLPIVSLWMKAIGCIFIDRSDKRGALEVIRTGVEKIRNGQSIILFPEGTRSRGPKLNRFKPGSLKLPIRSGATILPITISGSYKLKEETGYITPGEVTITVHPPLDAADFREDETTRLAEILVRTIEKKLPHVQQ